MPNSPTATREGVEERARECLAVTVEQDAASIANYNLAKGAAYYIRDCQGQLIWAVTAMRAMLAFAQSERLADGWQDIATAPREGYFLVWGPHHPELAFPYEAERFWKARDPGFPGHLSSKAFTLWHRMPLPEPPATAIRSADQ